MFSNAPVDLGIANLQAIDLRTRDFQPIVDQVIDDLLAVRDFVARLASSFIRCWISYSVIGEPLAMTTT